MALEKAPSWTDLYYQIVEHYFWRPQAIGRISDPDKPANPWNHWKKKLQSQETPLNHMLDILFHVIPQELLDRVISALLGRTVTDLQLVALSDGMIDGNIVQPDIILSNAAEVVFVEMKVDSQSSIDQFVKYAIAAHCIKQSDPSIKSYDLVVLAKRAEHEHVWKNAHKFGLTNETSVRNTALRALLTDPSIWGQRGVQSYLKANPTALDDLCQLVRTMGLSLSDYSAFDSTLREYAAEEKTVERLITGILKEFTQRKLV